MRRHRKIFTLLLTFHIGGSVHAQLPQHQWWVPNRAVFGSAIHPGANELYLAGYMTQIGPATPHHAALDPVSAEPLPSPRTDAGVVKHVNDGAGGWFGHGSFTRFGAEPRNRLVRVNGDGSIHPWHPIVDGAVKDLSFSDGVVYIVGEFTSVNGTMHPYVAALDPETGSLLEWDPQPDGPVNVVAVVGDTVYLGGAFSTVGGQPRNNFCGVTATNAAVLPWAPDVGGIVNLLSANSSGLALGAAGYLRCYDGEGNSLPVPTVSTFGLFDIELVNDTLYVCGQLLQNGLSHGVYACALGGEAFLLMENISVNAIDVHEDELYIAGDFAEIAGSTKYGLAKMDRITGALSEWAPMMSDWLTEVEVIEGKVWVSGAFVSASGVRRKCMAAMDIETGLPTDWLPPDVEYVQELAIHDDVLYFAGSFSVVDGQARSGLAAYDLAAGVLLDWAPQVEIGSIIKIKVVGDTIFFSGTFQTYDGQPRTCLAAIDANTRELLNWAPIFAGPGLVVVNELSVSGGSVYCAGMFTSVNGQARNGLAAVERSTSNVDAWIPETLEQPTVFDIIAQGDRVYIANASIQLNGEWTWGVTAVDAVTGSTTLWHTAVDDPSSIALTDSSLFVAGAYITNVGGYPRSGIAQIDPLDGNLLSWDLSPEFSSSNDTQLPWLLSHGQRLFMSCGISQDSILLSPYFGVLGQGITTGAREPNASIGRMWAFPNPSSGLLQLQGIPANAASLEVVGMAGQIELQSPVKSMLDLSGLPAGVHMVRALDRNGTLLRGSLVVLLR
jgi:hypothetical protein